MRIHELQGPYITYEAPMTEGRMLDLAKKLAKPMMASMMMTLSGGTAADSFDPVVADQVFSSTEEAVSVLSHKFNPESIATNAEYIGYVMSCPDGVRATYVKGLRNKGSVSVRIALPQDCELEAMWHTHGSPGKLKSGFSPDDVKMAKILDVPVYMIDPENTIRVFNNGDKVARRSKPMRISTGSYMQFPKGSAPGTVVNY